MLYFTSSTMIQNRLTPFLEYFSCAMPLLFEEIYFFRDNLWGSVWGDVKQLPKYVLHFIFDGIRELCWSTAALLSFSSSFLGETDVIVPLFLSTNARSGLHNSYIQSLEWKWCDFITLFPPIMFFQSVDLTFIVCHIFIFNPCYWEPIAVGPYFLWCRLQAEFMPYNLLNSSVPKGE